jgi:hypothetical protein
MTTLQKTSVTAVLIASLGVAIHQARRASTLESELRVLQGQNTSLAAHMQQQESRPEEGEHRTERSDPTAKPPSADTPELLRLRGEVGLLRRRLADAEASAQSGTSRILFPHPILPRAAWSDQGTAKPQDTILTMFWALRQGDQSKLEQLLRMGGSQTPDDLTFPRDEWDKFSAIQVATVVVTRQGTAGKVAAETATVQVIAEKALRADGADTDADIYRWVLIKEDDQWLIRNRF